MPPTPDSNGIEAEQKKKKQRKKKVQEQKKKCRVYRKFCVQIFWSNIYFVITYMCFLSRNIFVRISMFFIFIHTYIF